MCGRIKKCLASEIRQSGSQLYMEALKALLNKPRNKHTDIKRIETEAWLGKVDIESIKEN